MLNLERDFLKNIAPQIGEKLSEGSVFDLEKNNNNLVELFRSDRLPGMFVGKDHSGMGLGGIEAIKIQMAIASRAPSLALMMTMHNFTVLTLAHLTKILPYSEAILGAAAQDNCFIASGFAEGKSGADIFESSVIATPVEGGYKLNGAKKPCTMAKQFDYLTAGICSIAEDGSSLPGLAIIPKDAGGIVTQDFWSSSVLAAAGSHEVQLNDVFVDNSKVFLLDNNDPELHSKLLKAHSLGLSWFQLFVSSSYLGIAGALIDILLKKTKKDSSALFDLSVSFQASVCMLEHLASMLDNVEEASDVFEKSLAVRFSIQQQINKITDICVDQLGGLSYIQNKDVQYLLTASRCLAFHPLSRSASIDLLAQYLERR